MSLDLVLPALDDDDRHRRSFHAPEQALQSVTAVGPGDIPRSRLLMGMRSVGAPGKCSLGMAPSWELGSAAGFRLLEETPDRVIAGAIGQVWRLRGGESACFEGRYVDAFVGSGVDEGEPVTETRIPGTGPLSMWWIARHWLLFRPCGGLIRGGWLRAGDKRSAA